MKKGDKVYCINTSNDTVYLTFQKEYTILGIDGIDMIRVMNDDRFDVSYSKLRFKLVKDNKEDYEIF